MPVVKPRCRMDSDLTKGEESYSVAHTASDMPTSYTSTSHYPTSDIPGYYTEIDWQNSSLDPTRSMYSIAPRPEVAPLQYYSGYTPVSHPADIYSTHVLWHDGTLQLNGSEPSPHTNGVAIRRETSRTSSSSNGRPKRRRTQSLVQRRAANVRERRRMFQLNEAFDELRKKLPAFNYEKRLSRIETLRLAMTYISFMHEVTTGTDPKHVKLLSYHSDDSNHKYGLDLQTNDYNSQDEQDELDMVVHGDQLSEPPTLVEASSQSNLTLVPTSAVQVQMLPTLPSTIALPVTDNVLLSEAEIQVVDDQEATEAAQQIEEQNHSSEHDMTPSS